MHCDQAADLAADDDLDLADVQRDQILDELRAVRLEAQRARSVRKYQSLLLVLILIAVLWSAAEAHDSNCYALGQVGQLMDLTEGREPSSYAVPSDCSILPWSGWYDD